MIFTSGKGTSENKKIVIQGNQYIISLFNFFHAILGPEVR